MYVIDDSLESKKTIYDFIDESDKLIIYVDCENVDPYKFASIFLDFDRNKLAKIERIVLIDDVNTTNAWDLLKDNISLNIEHLETQRILNEKSLVDHFLSIRVTKDYYEKQIKNVIIVSSDSDFWSLVSELPQVKFFIMNEKDKTSYAIIEKLNENKIKYCCMDDFTLEKIQEFKNTVLLKNLSEFIKNFNDNGIFGCLSVNDLVNELFMKSGINGHPRQVEAEKKEFIKRYLKNIKLILVGEVNNLKFQIPFPTAT